MIELSRVSKLYHSSYALKDVSFSLESGKLAVLGYNGAGKSTLAKIIAGIIKPSSGKVKVLGRDPIKSSEVRKRIGVVTHNPMLYRDLTVKENLEFYSRLYGVDFSSKLAKFFKFDDRLDSKVSELSRGLLQRVAVARAIIAEPEVLIMDEATSGLDVESREIVLKFMKDFAGILIFTTHNLEEANFCDYFLVLENGEIKYFGEEYEQAAGLLKVS